MAKIETVVNAYKALAKVHSLSGATLNSTGNRIRSTWSVRSVERGQSTGYSYDYYLDDQLKVIAESDFGTAVSNEPIRSASPSDKYVALIRKDTTNEYLEIWESNRRIHDVNLTGKNLHGVVYTDAEFGCLSWSRDETAVVFVAERKLTKSEPYIKTKSPEELKSTEDVTRGEEYLYKQDWGESLVGKHLSVIVVYNLVNETLTVLQGLPDDWCPGQVSFSKNGLAVFGLAYETEPRRLGLRSCTNRPSYIFRLSFDQIITKLSAEGKSVRSPRVSPSGDKLVWLQRTEGGPHHACHQLIVANTGDLTSRVVIDVVKTSISTANGDLFYGLYTDLPLNCFSNDEKKILFNSVALVENRAYVVEIDTGKIVDISNNKDIPGSTTILDVRNNVVISSYSNLSIPSQLFIGRLSDLDVLDTKTRKTWFRISKPVEVPETVAKSTVTYMNMEHPDSTDSIKSFTAIMFSPPVSGNEKLPLLVLPHGGPHSASINSYALSSALYVSVGFAYLQVNFRGSTGAGQDTIDFLLGKVGTADVEDCRYVTEEAVKRFQIDQNRLAATGGSHGGFLVTHLAGQYPNLFKSIVARNPVIDIAAMFNTTDITDWCAVEAGFPFTEQGPVTEDQLLAMRRCSPLAHVHQVKAPTALMLGSIDLRVNYYQGLEFYRRLKANGVSTRLYMYEDNHSLATQAVEVDNLINGTYWLLEHLHDPTYEIIYK